MHTPASVHFGTATDIRTRRKASTAQSIAAVAPSYKGFRYPVEVISHWVWLMP
jgi:hypothetical protein